jgi:hypothetical protein
MRAMTILAMVLSAVALLLWLAFAINVMTMNESDHAGNALSHSFAILMALALWILLVGLGWIGGAKALPSWLRGSGALFYPLSCAAALAAIELMVDRGGVSSRWPVVVPVLLPVLLMVSVGLAKWPWLRSHLPSAALDYAWIAIVILSLAPWLPLVLRTR